MKRKRLFLVLFLISLLGYGSAFFMESIVVKRSCEESNLNGYTAFYYGLLLVCYDFGIFRYGFHSSMLISVVCLANVAYLIGVFLFALRRYRGALVVSECGVFLAYPLLGMWIWGVPDISLSYGFFIWVGSIVLLAVASRLRLYFGTSRTAKPTVPLPEAALV